MKVLVDIGNSRTKYQVEGAEQPVAVTIANNLIEQAWLEEHWGNAKQVVVSSVKRGSLLDLVANWASSVNVHLTFVNSEKMRFGITNSYEQPELLGVDRWLSMIGGASKYPNTGLIIVDAGTATTLDVLDENGKHLGGWILSGIDLMLKQLGEHTSKVKYDISNEASIGFGQNTSECVNNAAWASTVSLIEAGIKQAQSEFAISQCILLGGNAEKLSSLIQYDNVIVDQTLIFEGLKRY